jgi:hypothetical protein
MRNPNGAVVARVGGRGWRVGWGAVVALFGDGWRVGGRGGVFGDGGRRRWGTVVASSLGDGGGVAGAPDHRLQCVMPPA